MVEIKMTNPLYKVCPLCLEEMQRAVREIERLRAGIKEAVENMYSHDVFQNLAKLIEPEKQP